ncbi:MAG TPA: cytidylate kinase-like family protein [Bryobacteraceae bacterium]|jgi:CMP/dCMP kinase|nr:cytidylate kinase-like family protein [Bryobacteraceae bacterium]
MVRAITVSREYGSGGGAVARILGKRLGWQVVDNAVVADIARSADANPNVVRLHEESVDAWFHRIMKALWRGGYMGAVARSDAEACDADAIARLWHRVIEESGAIGNCVTVGRGGQCLLQRNPDAFHAHIYAPMHDRMERLKSREPAGTDLAAAALDSDRQRSGYIRHYFDQDWRNPHLYHLMLCSSIGLERAADTILCAAGLTTRIQ